MGLSGVDAYGVHVDAGGGMRFEPLYAGFHRSREEKAIDQRCGHSGGAGNPADPRLPWRSTTQVDLDLFDVVKAVTGPLSYSFSYFKIMPQLVGAAAPAIDFVRSIGQIIETLSCDAFPSIETTASTIGTSVRTLQRQLAKAGYTHEQLLAQSRCAIATALLEKTDSKILDIALDLRFRS